MRPYSILVVDDEEGFRETVREYLTVQGYHSAAVGSAEDALALLRQQTFDVAVVDFRMPGMDGLALLKTLKAQQTIEVILITGQGTVSSAVDAMKNGAYTYLLKPVKLEELEVVIQKALEKSNLLRENILQKEELQYRRKIKGGDIIYKSKPMQELMQLVDKIAPSDSTVLIQGETGTGKELLANRIHLQSRRKDKPLVVIDCSAIPETLLEGELFGHEKGAYTGASEARHGLIEVADGGTLFIDEVGELSLQGQAKLLRVIEQGIIRRVGGNRELTVDVRIIAATNRDLAGRVRTGEFREDLYHRLNVIALHIPPLRERRDDIEGIATYFLAQYSVDRSHPKRLSPDALNILLSYQWHGNVRELANVLERAVLVSGNGEEITPTELGVEQRAKGKEGVSPSPSQLSTPNSQLPSLTLSAAERQHILNVMSLTKGDKRQAAKLLGITLRHLYRKLKGYKK